MEYEVEPLLRSLFRFAVAEIDGITVDASPPELKEEISRRVGKQLGAYIGKPLGEIDRIAKMRKTFKALGLDPARIRPSSEAILRRVLIERHLPSVNSVVDTGNLLTLTAHLPIGLYDPRGISGRTVRFRRGQPLERFRAVGGREIRIPGLCVAADERGAFGSPVYDAERTRIQISTSSLLLVAYAPASLSLIELSDFLDEACRTICRFNGGEVLSAQTI
ncbi:MAG: hypothetical protein D6812_01375 [Deltaproteobacteria bacterium]|nr:MAG: hypothetical protein D6812_01375 [Deltaproteobacteria bacterium]